MILWYPRVSVLVLKGTQELKLELPFFVVREIPIVGPPFKTNGIELRDAFFGNTAGISTRMILTTASLAFPAILVVLSLTIDPATQWDVVDNEILWHARVSVVALKCAQECKFFLPHGSAVRFGLF